MRRLALVLLVLGAGLPARPAGAPLRVVTSIETFAAIARAVGGDRVVVQALGKGYSDPHHVEPKLSLVTVLNQADLLVYVGLDLEVGWLPGLVTQARNPKIQPGSPGNLDCATVIPVLDVPSQKVDRSMGDIHPRGNPHYWIPPDNAVRIAREIATRLRQIDPKGAGTYEAGLRRFREEAGRRAPGWLQRAAPLKGQKVVTYHKSWGYVSAWLGLVEVGYVEPKPGVPPSPQHLANLVQLMKREGVRKVLIEMFYQRGLPSMVARQAAAVLLAMPADVGAFPQITDYFKLVDAIVDLLVR